MRSRLGNHRRLARADGTFAFAMALASVVYGNSARIPVGEMHRFLEMRITVQNAAFAGLFILMWAYCFETLGLYRSEHHGVLRELARIAVGCTLMTAVLVLYLISAQTTGPTARIAVLFFSCSVVYEGLRVFGSRWIAAQDPQLVVILGSGKRAAKAWRCIP